MLGYDSTDILKNVNDWQNLIHPEDRQKTYQVNLDCANNLTNYFKVEYRMKTSNGDWKWILGRGSAVHRDHAGRATRMIGTHQDISARKLTEEKLLAYKFALEQSQDGIAFTDMAGHIRFVNKAWTVMHGYSRQDELVGCHLSVFHTPEQMEHEVAPYFKQLLVNGSGQGEFGHARKDGSTFPAFITASVVRWEDDKPFGVVAMARDISEEVATREQNRFNNHFKLFIAKASARLVLIHDNKTFNEAVDYVLASLGKLYDVDRGYLLRFSQDLSTMTNTHEWHAPGISPQIDRIQNTPSGDFPWMMARMKKLRPVHVRFHKSVRKIS
jgi:PAS domain S-box-containing protein